MAKKLDVHISTISRLTRSKYVHTPQGVFELKYFFGISYVNKKGERMSAKAIQSIIKKIIEKESVVLSDESIKNILSKEHGLLNVTRRLVARLREELGIPSASERKK